MLRVRINWTGLNQGFSVLHFLDGDDQSSADAVVSATESWVGAVDNFLRVDQAWQVDPEVLVVNPSTGQTTGVFTVATSPGTGADSGNAVPNASMILVRHRTGTYTSGRELRGRTFIPGCTATSVTTTGNVGTTAISAIDTATATLISNTQFAIYGPASGVTATVTSSSTWSEFATLRSRRD